MSKRIVTAVGIVIGVIVLVSVACSQQQDVKAPVTVVETTGSPVSSQPPVSILDTNGGLRIFRREGENGGALAIQALHDEIIRDVFGLDEDAVHDGAVAFQSDAERASREVWTGRGAVALFVNPLTPDDVFETAARGRLLPQKSTYFYPKLPSGLVFRPLEEGP